DRPRGARKERARSGVVRYIYRPRLFLTESRPGLPSNVVTPSSQAVSCGGLVFSHSCAAFGPSSPSVRILFITRFSMAAVKMRLLMSFAGFGHCPAQPAPSLV